MSGRVSLFVLNLGHIRIKREVAVPRGLHQQPRDMGAWEPKLFNPSSQEMIQ